ncbi:MAG: xylulokinase, partial [Chloroflexi bacterium]|nr:xylulokinase [Chloroflexota bacterium]
MTNLFLGIDVATTGAKALLIDEKGTVIANATAGYPLSTPRPLWSEQSPADWWAGVTASVRQVLAQGNIDPAAVMAVGLTGQMHGLVLLDEAGRVLRPAILWNDQRTAAECDEIRRRLGKQRLIELTGNDALTGFTAPKILWVREHEPDTFARARHILLPKDYVRLRLTGSYATDRAGAAGTLLLNIKTRDWSAEVLQALDIPATWLPPTHEGQEITGRISAEAAQATGLKAGTPVVAGGGDQAAQAVGVGAVQPGIVALTLGTSGVVFAPTDEPVVEPEGRLHAFCHAAPGRWHLMGVMLSAGGSLRWYHDTLAAGT